MKLAPKHFLVVQHLGMLFEKFLVFLERFFIVAFYFETPSYQVLSPRRVIREGPYSDYPAGGFEGETVIGLVEGGLRNIQLVFGAWPLPFSHTAHGFVSPSFAGGINEGRGRTVGKSKQTEND